MQATHHQLKKKTFIKVDRTNENQENQDEIMENLLREDNKNFKNSGVNYEKFKIAQPKCDCDICGLDLEYIRKNEELKKRPAYDSDYNPLDEKILKDPIKKQNDQEKDFVFIVKRLQLVKPTNRSIGIWIPDTVAFQNSEAKFIVYTQKQNKQFKFLKQKEKLTSHQIRKYFQEKRIKPKENSNIGNSEIINLPKEMVICKYADESTQILSEIEFINLITKRKQDASWKDIQYLQLFIKTKKFPYEVTKIKFKWDPSLKQDPLYMRAQNDIAIMNGDIAYYSTDFVSMEDEDIYQEKLKNTNFNDFCRYMFYKIHIFIEKFYSILIIKVYNEFIKDETNCVYYINAFNLKFEALDKGFLLGEEFYKNMLNDPVIKETERLRKQYAELQKNELHGLFAKVFYQDYEQLKTNTGLELHITKPEQTLNEDIFNKIYPNTIYKLSDLLSNKLQIEEIKKILNNGIASKEKKKSQSDLFPRKKMFKNYTLPSLKQNQKPSGQEPTIFQTPQRPSMTASSRSGQSPIIDSSGQKAKRKFRFIKSPTVKITYQLGPSLTDTHSIRIQGKLLERINIRNSMWKTKSGGVLGVMGVNDSLSKANSTPKHDLVEEKAKPFVVPSICVHEVEFKSIF